MLGVACAHGCQAMYFLTDPEKQKDVPAEYGKIGERKVAVLVWADSPTLDMDRKARRRVCDAVTYDMKKHLDKATFKEPKEVQNFQERSGLDWESMSVGQLCGELKTDFILRIDLLEYTTRRADARELQKARVRGTVNLYECGDTAGENAVYSTEVVADFPPAGANRLHDLDDDALLHEAVVAFGQAVGQKFYDHGVSMRGRQDN